MNNISKKSRKLISSVLTITTTLWSVGFFSFFAVVPVVQAATGDLIKFKSAVPPYTANAVYSITGTDTDGKTVVSVFPHSSLFQSWGYETAAGEPDFSSVTEVEYSSETYVLGQPVQPRPGFIFKATGAQIGALSETAVVVVDADGSVRPIKSADIYQKLYKDENWSRVTEVPADLLDKFPLTIGDLVDEESTYPTGTLLKSTAGDVYIVNTDGSKSKFEGESLTANRFSTTSLLIPAIAVTDETLTTYTDGAAISGADSGLKNPQAKAAPATEGTEEEGTEEEVTEGEGTEEEVTEEEVAPVVTGEVTISSSASAAGTLIEGQALAPLLDVVVTNNADGEVTLTRLKLTRTGVSGNSTLGSVYLYDGNVRATNGVSLSSGTVNFVKSSGIATVAAGASKTITVKADVGSDVTGQTIGLQVAALTDVVVSGGTVAGTFPVAGSTYTVASITNLATALFDEDGTTPLAATIDPQADYTVWSNKVTIANQDVTLTSLSLSQGGSIDLEDLNNFRLFVDGKEAATVASLDADKYLRFDLTDNPAELKKGNNRPIKVLANVVGGSAKNFSFSLKKAADINLVDSSYNVSILVADDGATDDPDVPSKFTALSTKTIEVSSGSLTITKATASPSDDLILDATGQTLAIFDLKATGEDIVVDNLTVKADVLDGDGASEIATIPNGALYLGDSQISSTADLTSGGTNFEFGTQLTVKAGETVQLTVKADVDDNDDGTDDVKKDYTLQVTIAQGSSNAEGSVSGTISSVPSAADGLAGNTLTVTQGEATLTDFVGFSGDSVVVPTDKAVQLAEFILTSSKAEALEVNSFDLYVDVGNDNDDKAKDLGQVYLKYGSDLDKVTSEQDFTLAGTTDTTGATDPDADAAAAAAAGTKTYNTNGYTLAANKSTHVQVWATLGDTNLTSGDIIKFNLAVNGTGAETGAEANATNVTGQTMTVSDSGTLTISLASNNPAEGIVLANSVDTALVIELEATNEDIHVSNLKFTQTNSAVHSVNVENGDGEVINTTPLNGDTLTLFETIVVSKDEPITLTVKPTYAPKLTGITSTLSLSSLTAKNSSGTDIAEANILVDGAQFTTPLDGKAQTIYQAKPTVSPESVTSLTLGGRNKPVYQVKISNDAAAPKDLTLESLNLNFQYTDGTSISDVNLSLSTDSTVTVLCTGVASAAGVTTLERTCDLSKLSSKGNIVAPGEAKIYLVEADVAGVSGGGALIVEMSEKGTSAAGGADLTWSDTETTGIAWLDQVATLTAQDHPEIDGGGIADATPLITIANVTLADVSGTSNNMIDTGDTIIINTTNNETIGGASAGTVNVILDGKTITVEGIATIAVNEELTDGTPEAIQTISSSYEITAGSIKVIVGTLTTSLNATPDITTSDTPVNVLVGGIVVNAVGNPLDTETDIAATNNF